MDERAAASLVAQARASPQEGFDALQSELRDGNASLAVQSILWRGLGDAARWVGTIAQSLEFLTRAAEIGRSADRSDLVGEAQLTLAGSQHLGGDATGALKTLHDLAVDASGSLAARVEFQRATILAREGRLDVAIDALGVALRRFEELGDARFAAASLGNRGLAYLDSGDVRSARRDLERAHEGFRVVGARVSLAGMEHNLGRVAGRSGDVVRALAHFRASESAFRRLRVDPTEVQVNRCEVLLDAGLYGEAVALARRTEAAMAARGLETDRAEASMALSIGLMGQQRYDDAAQISHAAVMLFESQGRDFPAARARLIELSCLAAVGVVVEDEAASIAEAFESDSEWRYAARAWAVVGRTAPHRALRALQAFPSSSTSWPLEFQLLRLEVRARERVAVSDLSEAFRLTRAAGEIGRRRRVLLGTADLRAAVSAQLDGMRQFGLDLRVGANRPWAVLRWVDLCRGGSTATPSVAEGGEVSEYGGLLGRLRAVQRASRGALDPGHVESLQREAVLQRQLITADRILRGRHRRVDTKLGRSIGDRLTGLSVVQYHQRGDRLGAVVVRRNQAQLVELGSVRQIDDVHARLRRCLRALAAGHHGEVEAVARYGRSLAEMMCPLLVDDETIVVPLAAHMGIPWSLLPPFQDRPVTVSPTIRQWIRTDSFVPGRTTSVGLVQGPDLAGHTSEIGKVASVWSQHRIVSPSRPTAADTFELLSRVDIAHLACHGDRRVRDGRFAKLRLADGDLTSLELEGLSKSPRVVVLAACEAGVLDSLPGDEASGLATALFSVSTETIVAPVTLLPDDQTTADLFVDFHRRLAAGSRPALALYDAREQAAPGPDRVLAQTISCFGRG